MATPGSINELLIGAAGAAGGGYEISRSIRFNSSDSAYLSRTPASAGNRRTFTFSFWVKRGTLPNADQMRIFNCGPYTSGTSFRSFNISFNGKSLFVWDYLSTYNVNLESLSFYRDPSAWYHIAVIVDTTQATSTDRVKIYVNGVAVTGFISNGYPSQNYDTAVGVAEEMRIGTRESKASEFFDGYLADFRYLDGVAASIGDLGEFDDNGIWQPIAYSGSYGTNGFHLPFSDNSTAAALGTDTSGNGNDWTVNNIAGAELPATKNVSVTAFPGVTSVKINNITRAITSDNIDTLLRLPYYQNTALNLAGRIYNQIILGGTSGSSITIAWSGLSGITGITLLLQRVSSIDSTWEITGDITGSGSTGSFAYYTFPTSSDSGSFTLTTTNSSNGLNVAGVTFEPYGLSERTDSFVDSPSNGDTASDTGAGNELAANYCTQNPLDNTLTLSNGNLEIIDNTALGQTAVSYANFAVSSGKWYWEYENTKTGTIRTISGITPPGRGFPADYIGATADEYGFTWTGTTRNAGLFPVWGEALSTAGQILMTALDLDNGKIWWGLDGVWFESGDPASGLNEAFSGITGTYVPAFQKGTTTTGTVYTGAFVNFGQRPFAYTAPSGYKALCTTNLPAPTIEDGSTAMDISLWTGDDATPRVISGLGFSPDFVWIKQRNNSRDHALFDVIRGANEALFSNATTAETSYANTLMSFDSDGFSVGGNALTNVATGTYVGWTWDAGSSTVTNTAGSITSTVRANPSAGFSIVSYTPPSSTSNATVGHGLSVTPKFIIVKNRSTTTDWIVYTTVIDGSNDYLVLNSTNGAGNAAPTAPTSSVFYVWSNADTGAAGSNYIAYCFTPVEGYSAFGSYTGNGSADGPFVYTGFRPKFILIKVADTTGSWQIIDSQRLGYNVKNNSLYPNLSNAEADPTLADIVSNGFKLRMAADTIGNGSGNTYIYAAFAESPFQYARAR